MREKNTSHLLMQLLVHQYRSLPMFLTEAAPWTHRGDENATRVLLDVVEGQRDLSNRIAAELEQRGCSIDLGEYEMEFLDLHFLSLEFLLQRLVENQESEVESIGRIVEQLDGDSIACNLAKEAMGAAKGYLESLMELTPNVVPES